MAGKSVPGLGKLPVAVVTGGAVGGSPVTQTAGAKVSSEAAVMQMV